MAESAVGARGNTALRTLRWSYNWTQEDFAEKFQVKAGELGLSLALSERQIRRWEGSTPPWPHRPYRVVLEALFGVSVTQMGFQPRTVAPAVVVSPGLASILDQCSASDRTSQAVHRRAFLRGLGAVTGIAAAAVAGPQLTGDIAARIGAAVLSLSPVHGDTTPVGVADLRRNVADAKRAFQSCRYSQLDELLPVLLVTAAASGEAGDADDLPIILQLQADAFHVTASRLLKLGRHDLALIAADRSLTAARSCGNPLAQAAGARILTHAVLAAGDPHLAKQIATDAAHNLSNPSPERDPQFLSVSGALLLRGAIAASRADDRQTALALLAEADATAARIGVDANHRWTAFGPTNVAQHRVAVSVELGDAGYAIEQARRIQPTAIDLIERRAALWIDVARAFGQWGKDREAIGALTSAERIAPEEVRSRYAVRQLVEDLWTRPHRTPSPQLRGLALRVGALV